MQTYNIQIQETHPDKTSLLVFVVSNFLFLLQLACVNIGLLGQSLLPSMSLQRTNKADPDPDPDPNPNPDPDPDPDPGPDPNPVQVWSIWSLSPWFAQSIPESCPLADVTDVVKLTSDPDVRL